MLAVGDIHLENFGTWRDVEGRLIWGVNDYDEAHEMPYALDLVRLGVSAALGTPHLDTDKHICGHILEGYRAGLKDPHPIVLDQDYAWMRSIFVVKRRSGSTSGRRSMRSAPASSVGAESLYQGAAGRAARSED